MDVYPNESQLTWNQQLLDAWKVGAISDETYQKAKNEAIDAG